MKKLIVLSVIFALVASSAFAVDLGANVIGTIVPLSSSTEDDAKINASGGMDRMRIDGYAEVNENFGGWIRFSGAWLDLGDPTDPKVQNGIDGYAFWKPIDQFKLIIGGNGDGFFGKEGNTGWGFYGEPSDCGVTFGGDNVWGSSLYGYYDKLLDKDVNNIGMTTRVAFYGGGRDHGALMTITPADIVSINIVVPFFSEGETADVFKKTMAQLDFNLDFGNIALTYLGASGDGKDQPQVFAYFGGNFGDLGLDFGVGYGFAYGEYTDDGGIKHDSGEAQPIGVGLGLKYATDSFGIKFRAAASLAGDDKATKILADVLPYIPLGDNLTAFVSAGIGMAMTDDDSFFGWHFNPYLQVGDSAKFLVGIKVYSPPAEKDKDAVIYWSVPISIMVGF